MSARLLTSSVLRNARPRLHVFLPRRTLSGPKPKSPPTAPDIDDADLFQTTHMVQDILRDKPDAVNAVLKLRKALEDAGVSISTGQMPGPMQMMKLAYNSKFKEAVAEVEAEFAKAGVDIRSKEFMEQMMKIVKQMPRGP